MATTNPWLLAADLFDPPPRPRSAWYCDRPDCDGQPHDDWPQRHARAQQHPPRGDWLRWLILAGRGFGKTRCGAEWLAEEATTSEPGEWAVIAPTYGDVRDTCVEGESGLLRALGGDVAVGGEVRRYNRSLGEIDLCNGGKVFMRSADEPARLRGRNLRGAWWDEFTLSRSAEELYTEVLVPALRRGEHPRLVLTATPKRRPLLLELLDRGDGSVRTTRGSTFDNAANLSASALEELRRRYEGTTIGRQELYAEVLDDVEGALWRRSWIDDHRVASGAPYGLGGGLVRVVVGVDPAVTSGPDSDETGIVVVGLGRDGDLYVLADLTLRATPDEWARASVRAYIDHEADEVVAEANNGGDLVLHVLRTVDLTVPVRTVHASRGKVPRADPIVALYQQGRVHHVGAFPELEDQLASWVPTDPKSPDRLDALVWAATEVMGSGAQSSQTRWSDRRLRGRSAR